MAVSAIFSRYPAATSPSSSPSSLRMASICWRSMNSRWRFSMLSLTSVRMRAFSSSSPSVSRAQASAFSRRSVTSMVSSNSMRCSKVRSGE